MDSVNSSPNPLLLTDHFLVSFLLSVDVGPPSVVVKSHYVLDYAKLDYEGMADHLLNIDYSSCLYCTDVEVIWCNLRSIINDAINRFAPRVKIRAKKNHPKWYNSAVRHHINCVRSIRKKAMLNPSATNISKLEKAELNLCSSMTAAKSSYEVKLVDEFAFNNSNKIHKYIKSILKTNNLPVSMCLNTHTVTSDGDKASLFNKFFESVYSKSDSGHHPNSTSLQTPTTVLDHLVISDTEVYTALASLDPSKTSGIDNIGPRILKSCSLALYPVVHHLFSLSLQNCIIPSEWKVHCIIPIFKSGDKNMVSNYRPISLLCVISKVLEKIIYDKVFVFIGKSITSAQFGFLRNHSCLQQLLTFLWGVIDTMEKKCQLDTIYLDFQKAFDRVPHQDLLGKLKALGIFGKLWCWFHEYLNSRSQLVSINGIHSTLLPCSILRGSSREYTGALSILGPLLFLVYINDLPLSVSYSNIHLFADDTKCSHMIKSQSDAIQLQFDLDRLSHWSSLWRLLFNDEKCVLMQFCRNPHALVVDSSYRIAGKLITPRENHRDLGLILQQNLGWSNHYDLISGKAYGQLSLICRTLFSFSTSTSTKLKLYLSLVRSQLSYCSQLWRPAFIKDINALERIQRRATKFILRNPNMTYKERLTQLKLLPLMYHFELADIMFFIKSYNNQSCRFNIKNFISCQSNLNTRSSVKLTLRHSRSYSNQSRHFYFNRLPRLWNSLPAINISLSYECIKSKVKEFLWAHFLTNFNTDNLCSFHFHCPCSKCTAIPFHKGF